MLEIEKSISQISDGLESLKESLKHPKEGLLNPNGAQELFKESEDLDIKIIEVQEGPLALMRFALASQAKPTDIIGKIAVNKGFWKCLPDEERPKVGLTYQFVEDLIKRFGLTKPYLQKMQAQTSDLKKNLELIQFDLKMVLGKTWTKELISFASEQWRNISATPTRVSQRIERWGDVSSSEDEQLVKSISSLVKGSTSKTPGVKLPLDFPECFPGPFRKIEKFCDFHQWEITFSTESKLRSQGLVQFSELETGEIDSSRLDDTARVALASLYTAVASISIQPGSLVGEENTEVALTYVCSLVAKELLGRENSELLKVALKNGDGGRALLRGRFYSLTKSGSSAIKLVIEAIEKILEKFARDLDKDKIKGDLLDQITSRAFTSIDGMQDNSYRVAVIDSYKVEESTDRRGKTTKTKVKCKKQHRIVPDLSTATNPLKAEEISKINQIKDSFNNRKSVIEERLSKITQPTLLSKPKVCREVVLEAYEKLQAFKSIMRDRVVKIRDRATALSGGKKPDPSNWTIAKSEILKESPTIPETVWDGLKW